MRADNMSNKPIVTCAGDFNLFCTLEAPLVAAIPQDSNEWKRSYGRVVKSVYLEATFVKYDKESLQTENTWNILKRPILHVYWTDCADIESYKTTLREEIELWLKQLSHKDVTDWMIVHVETYDIRKTNKLLPRTTVLDKIKGDFSTKQNEDRFISVINPIKSESRSAESWRGLVARIRHFILASYNKTLIKFEEHMREQREKRNDPDWDFSKYFLLQEQLAFVLEMLSLYDEALIQYDELDALFTQFVLNSNVAEGPKWLASFQQPIVSWQAVRLGPKVPVQLRDMIVKRQATLLDFRSYLFQRQCAMLLLTFKPWEMASRCLSMVHNTIKELSMLDISVPEGAQSCWSLLTCTETLRTCEKLISGSPNVAHNVVEQCTAQQAPLWHYAKDKLYELGKLCGLLPGTPEPSSEQLHLVVMLSAGMGDSDIQQSTTDRLKEALGSKSSFQQYYLELAELAMGTYKHIGRLRFARLIGRDLAAFYSEIGECSPATVFLMDALRSYEEQGWKELATHTMLELAACAVKCNDMERYTKLSATIASAAELEILVRNFYFDEMLKTIKKHLATKTETVLSELNDCFKVVSAHIVPSERGIYITDNKVQCRLELESHLPREVLCNKAAISIESCKQPGDRHDKAAGDRHDKAAGDRHERTPVKGSKTDSLSSPKKVEGERDGVISGIVLDDLKPKNPFLSPLKITSQLHYKEDRTLDRATVECHNPKSTLKRSDSNKYRKQSNTVRDDFTNSMICENFVIKPGLNDLCLECVAKCPGQYRLGQLSLTVEGKLEFLSNVLIGTRVGFDVVTQGISVYLNKCDPKKDLVAGLEHCMELVISSGSCSIEENSTITLKTSPDLGVRFDNAEQVEMTRELTIIVPACKPFETTSVKLRLLAKLQSKKNRSVEHTVYLHCPHLWGATSTEVPLHFSPPLVASWRLLTSNTRKFLHVTVKSCVNQLMLFQLTQPMLECDSVKVACCNPKGGGGLIISSDGTDGSYMWELLNDPLAAPLPLKATFAVQYKLADTTEPYRAYACPLDVQDYTTLFVINTKLEPGRGSEFCRASQMCYLQLSVQRVNETELTSLMYEVLADQTMWAVCGKTAGVISVETDGEAHTVTLDVMPLIAGYLPLPTVRLSKYIAATGRDGRKDSASPHPRLEPFSPGQVYHAGKALQVHVLAPLPKETQD